MMEKHRESLLSAVKRGHLDTVHDLVEGGANVNASHGLQGTLLCAAIQANQPEVAIYLIDSDCDVNAADIDGEPPMCLAIRKGQKEILKSILESSRCDVHRVDPVSLNHPLSVAVTHGTIDTVKMLVNAGCDVNKQGKDYNTAWHLAVIHKKPDVIDVLLHGKNGDVNMWNKSGKTALHIAVEQSDTVMLSRLIEKCLMGSTSSHKKSSCRTLDLDRQIMFDGNTPLHLAIESGNFRSTEMLINAGCEVDIPNETMHTPLFFACKANCAATVALLLKNGANPNAAGECHKQFHVRNKLAVQTPLHVAIRRGSLPIVKLLIENGADLNLQAAGNYPLLQALMEDKPDIVNYFLTEGIHKGLDISLVDGKQGQNALGVVECCSNVREFTQKLINLGCLVSGCHDGRLPLEYAVDFDCTEAVEVLLDNGADVNMLLNGQTALQLCVFDDIVSEDMFHLLLFYGADINVTNQEGHSLLKLALDNFNTQIVKYLIAIGYNLSREPIVQNLSLSSKFQEMKMNGEGNNSDCENDSSSDNSSLTSRESQTEMYEWLLRQAAHPCPLEIQCRAAIRNHFLQKDIHMKRMEELPLPTKLKNYVMLKTLYEETMRIN